MMCNWDGRVEWKWDAMRSRNMMLREMVLGVVVCRWMIVEVETQEKLRRARLALVMSDVSMFLKLAWMSVTVVEEKKMMVEL